MRETEEHAHEFISRHLAPVSTAQHAQVKNRGRPLTLTCSECLVRVRDDAEFCPNCLSPDLSTKSPRELELLWEDPAPTWEELTVSILLWVDVSILLSGDGSIFVSVDVSVFVSVAGRGRSDFEIGVLQ